MPTSGYTAEQRHNLQLAKIIGRRVGATAREQKAAIEAQLVESGARNLTYGDRDSVGILQQRPSQGWSHAADPVGALTDFYGHAKQFRGQKISAGALAQAVQRSAYPGRYDQQSAQADAVLGSGGGYAAPGGPAAAPTLPGVDRQALLQQYAPKALTDKGLLELAPLLQNASQTPAAGAYTPPGDVGGIAARASRIDRQRLPYQWGGGHGQVRDGQPLDCSGAVSKVLGIDPRVSGQFKTWGKPGRGSRVTVYSNDSHVLMEVDGHLWGTSAGNPGGGPGWIPRGQVSASYLKGFVARHPPGM